MKQINLPSEAVAYYSKTSNIFFPKLPNDNATSSQTLKLLL